MWPRLECSGKFTRMIIVHYSLKVLDWRSPSALASWISRPTSVCHHVWLVSLHSWLSVIWSCLFAGLIIFLLYDRHCVGGFQIIFHQKRFPFFSVRQTWWVADHVNPFIGHGLPSLFIRILVSLVLIASTNLWCPKNCNFIRYEGFHSCSRGSTGLPQNYNLPRNGSSLVFFKRKKMNAHELTEWF